LKTKNVYISMPWRDINSGLQALQVCKKAIEMGVNPICWSVMYSQLLDFSDIKNREKAVGHTVSLMGVCDEVWVFGSARTPFMTKELEDALSHNLPVIEHSILDFLHSVK
jgi:hypothetical protein